MPERDLTATPSHFPWILFIFLFVVFAMSSWNLTRPRDGYDAADANELSETAESGSLGRQIALTCLGLFALATARSTFRNIRVNGLTGAAFLAYVTWACASVAWSTDIGLTSKAAVRLLLMCCGALAISKRLTIRQIAHVAFGISALTLLISLALEITSGTFGPANPSWRLAGVMHPVSQGWNCSLLCLAAQHLSTHASRASKYAYRSAMVLGIVFLTLTKSRMAFAATLLSMAIYYLWNSTQLQRVISLAAFGSAVCLALLFMGGSFHHYAALGRESETEASFGTLTGRLPLWEECLRYSQKKPILGYGYNTFISPTNLLGISDASGWMSSPHSGYIGTLFELGAIGLTLGNYLLDRLA
jgi:exopolysaccharide production protein ExoQ